MNHEPSIVREGDLLFHAARKIRKRHLEIRWRDLASVASMPTSLAPPVNISGAPHSSSVTWAWAWQNIAPNGGGSGGD